MGRPPLVKKATLVGGSMEDNEALDRIDEMRDLVNANLESIIAEQSAVFGEVAEVSGQVVLAGGKRIRPIMVMLALDWEEVQDLAEIIHFEFSNDSIIILILVLEISMVKV